MKAKDLRERTTEDLQELRAMIKKDLFSYRMRNYTNQLDDTSLLRKSRRDIARIELILHQRALQAARAEIRESGGVPAGASCNVNPNGTVTIQDARQQRRYQIVPTKEPAPPLE